MWVYGGGKWGSCKDTSSLYYEGAREAAQCASLIPCQQRSVHHSPRVALCRNVTIGAYGELWQVPLSTSDGRGLYDAGIQYPWSGQAQLEWVVLHP